MKISLEDLEKVRKLFRSPALTQVYRWSKCVHNRVLYICLLNVTLVSCSLGITLETKELVDAAISSQEELLWRNGIILLLLVLLQLGLGFIASWLRIETSSRLQRHLQGTLIRDIMTKEFASLKCYHSGELVNRVFSDAGVIRNGALSILPGIISTLVSFIGAVVILVTLDWRFVLLLAFAGLLGTGIMLVFRKPMKERHIRMQKAEDKLHASVQEAFENIRLIKASLSEKRVFRQIDNRQETMEREQIRQGKFHAVMNNSMGFMFTFSWVFCMLWGCAAIFRGEMTYGSLAAMIQLIGRVQGPITNVVNIAGDIYRVIASAERLMELTDLPSETMGELLTKFDEIIINELTFRYEDGTDDVLQDINCTIKRGDFVALTGTSGGGKTSLFQLLLGIYHPNSGEIVFVHEGKKVNACRESRALFSYVPQGNTLFSGTLRENLLMFTDEVSETRINKVLQIACIDDLAAEIGLDTELGERGAGISEGQAQRVAVARALLTGAPILLLDESTSALDEETESRMLKNISEMRDKTCLIVTHRNAALAICDYRLHIIDRRITKEKVLQKEKEDDACTITKSLT